MNKTLLHRYFEGKSSRIEEQNIEQWLNESQENFDLFMQERKAYDVLLMSSDRKENTFPIRKHKDYKFVFAAVAGLLLFGMATVFYKWFSKIDEIDHYNTIVVPSGQHIKLYLSDKTAIWLNANSTFKYPSQFENGDREVYLEGEGYFEVSENKKNPFVVKTKMADVRVTGTKFNVKSIEDRRVFQTSLFEGGVDIIKDNRQIFKLKPNQRVDYINDDFLVSSIDNDTDRYLWRNGLIAFRNEEMQKVFKTFEEVYGVKIHISTTKNFKDTYTGKFRQGDGLDYALRILQSSISFQYNRNNETQEIYIN